MERPGVDLSDASKKSILVVGDFLLDHYVYLEPTRISPEAPVMICETRGEDFFLGGAANVANNVYKMGANVSLASIVGKEWEELYDCSNFPPIKFKLHLSKDHHTTIKKRLVTSRQQLLRIDTSKENVTTYALTQLKNGVSQTLELDRFDVVVFSDYAHGVMMPEIVRPLLERCRAKGIPTIVDSKAPDTIEKYRGCSIAVPNVREARLFSNKPRLSHNRVVSEEVPDMIASEIKNLNDEDMSFAAWLRNEMDADAVGLTAGPRGIVVSLRNQDVTVYEPTELDIKHEVIDVTGAGDTVTATVAVCLALGMGYEESIKVANIAAGIAVRKKGVSTVCAAEIKEHYKCKKVTKQ